MSFNTDLKPSENIKGALYFGISYNLGTIGTKKDVRILN